MSPSLKQFMIISIVGMTVLLASLLYFHVELSEDYLETHLDTHNKNLAIVLRNSLLSKGLEKVLINEKEGISDSLRDHIQSTVEEELRWVPVIKVKVYSRDGMVLYSSKQEEIGNSARSNPGVQKALSGESISGLVHRNHVNEFDNTIEVLSLHQQYIPISNHLTGEVLGAFEIYTDISKILAQVEAKQRRIFWSIGGGLLVFYFALAMIFMGTHRLLRKETAQRVAHLQELQSIHADLEDRVAQRTADLDQSKQFLQSVIDGIGNPLMVIRPDFNISLMNRAAKELIPKGTTADKYQFCYQVSHRLDKPCLAPDHPCSFTQVMEQGCTARVRHTHYDADDNPILVDLVSTPLYSVSGEFEGVIEVQHDITRLVQMQAGLAQSEARLQAIMDNVPDAILTCDGEYSIKSINPAAMTLFNTHEADIVGTNFRALFSDSSRKNIFNPQSAGQTVAILKRVRGEEFPADIWVGPMQSTDSGNSYIAVVRDITRRLQAQQELETTRQQFFHQEKMAAIGHLAAGILHEVGNPIAAIAGAASDLKSVALAHSDGIDEQTAQDYVGNNIDLINEQATRLAKITREIADFASPKPRARELLDLNGLLNSTARLLSYDRRFSEIDMQLDLDKDLPAINGVADQLTQVFMNLLINAMDASASVDREKVRIRMSTEWDGGRVQVTVQDFGIGMNRETLDHALEPFYTTKPVGKGTGLGLSLCDSIITSHGGVLDIQSEVGRGTKVTVTLPGNLT